MATTITVMDTIVGTGMVLGADMAATIMIGTITNTESIITYDTMIMGIAIAIVIVIITISTVIADIMQIVIVIMTEAIIITEVVIHTGIVIVTIDEIEIVEIATEIIIEVVASLHVSFSN